jgi:hypothetical protein
MRFFGGRRAGLGLCLIGYRNKEGESGVLVLWARMGVRRRLLVRCRDWELRR